MANDRRVKVGVVGCGCISAIYMKNLTQVFGNVEVIACTDLIRERSENRAKEYGIPRVYEPEEFYRDEDIELVVNLTPPRAHTEVELLALNAGKHIYTEKPFGIIREDAVKVMELAKAKGLMAGGAPETFLGGGIQTCRKVIDEGLIGRPISVLGFMMGHGPESWHPDPEFFYKRGAGPMFDMGPYYITTMINLLGPIKKVAGSTTIATPVRTATCKEKNGLQIEVEIPTYIAGTLTFESGVIGTLVTSFDTWATSHHNIEIQGTEGTLLVHDPNNFSGPLKYRRYDMNEWKDIEVVYPYKENTRGIGVADMCRVILEGKGGKSRVDASMPFHVLDVMQSLHESSDTDRVITLSSTCERPAPLTLGLKEGEVY